MNIRRCSFFRTALLLPVMLLPACATIVDGTHQAVAVSTSPPGASCAVDRAGARLGVIPQTPGIVRVGKSKNSLMVTCGRPGFQTATVMQPSSLDYVTLGNLVIGGVVGVAVDAASGAIYEYPTDVRMALTTSPGAGTPPYAGQAPQQPYDPRAPYPATPYPVSQYTPPAGVLPDPVATHAASY